MKFTLQELLEQKALLEKQLDLINSWIEEIEGKRGRVETGPSPAVEAEKPAVRLEPLQGVAASVLEKAPATEASARQLDMSAYEGQTTLADTRKGCLLWTGIISALAIAALTLIYILYSS